MDQQIQLSQLVLTLQLHLENQFRPMALLVPKHLVGNRIPLLVLELLKVPIVLSRLARLVDLVLQLDMKCKFRLLHLGQVDLLGL